MPRQLSPFGRAPAAAARPGNAENAQLDYRVTVKKAQRVSLDGIMSSDVAHEAWSRGRISTVCAAHVADA